MKCFALPLSQVAVLARAAACFAWRTARGEPPEIDIELGVLSSDVQTEQCCGMDRMGPRTKSFKGSAVDSVDSTSQAWLAAWHSLPEVISAATPLVTSEALDGTGGIYVLKPPRWLNSYSWTDAAAYPVYIFWAILAVWIPLSWAGLVFRVFFTLESIW